MKTTVIEITCDQCGRQGLIEQGYLELRHIGGRAEGQSVIQTWHYCRTGCMPAAWRPA